MKTHRLTQALFCFSLLILIGSGCHASESADLAHYAQEIETELDPPTELQVPLEETEELRAEFIEEFEQVVGFDLYALYDEWIDDVGANGLIESIHEVYPKCHDRGHDLGRVIYHRIGEVGPALRTCEDACYSGCMHGVMMGIFTTEPQVPHDHDLIDYTTHSHVEIEDIKEQVKGVCATTESEQYRVGDCAHGVGHAIMYVSEYDIEPALEACDAFETYAEQYYCATGAYMEYVNVHDIRDSIERSGFYPCDEFDYPAACFRYKLAGVVRRVYELGAGTIENFAFDCEQLEGKYRLGCFHGLGNAHMGYVSGGVMTLDEVCVFGNADDQYVCIEGVMERMVKYHPEKAEAACDHVTGWHHDVCLQTLRNGLYNLDKSFELYQK